VRVGESPQLLAESSDDLGRLSALVAVLSQQSTTAASAVGHAAAADEEEADGSRTGATRASAGWWAWAGLGVSALVVSSVVKFGGLWPTTAESEATPAAVAPAKEVQGAAKRDAAKDGVKAGEPAVAAKQVARPVDSGGSKEAVEPKEAVKPEPVVPEGAANAAVDPAALKKANKLYMSGRAKEALVAVEEALAATPRDPQALLLKANILVERRDLDGARAAAQAAIAEDPALAGAYLALGVIEQEEKQVEAALRAYEKYLELAPKDRYAGTIRQQVKALRRGR
jgi:hypothetical protein